MFGFEYSVNKQKGFPKFDEKETVNKNDIDRIGLLVWQEHCVECAAPTCYKTCVLYNRRVDGRCMRFANGIERYSNQNSIFNQNIKINMFKWAKLESIVFTNSYSYEKANKYNDFLIKLSKRSKKSNRLKLFYYYVKEIYSRMVGFASKKMPKYLLLELYNDKPEFDLNIESKTYTEIIYRTLLHVKTGYNRLIIPTKDFNFKPKERNFIYLFPSSNDGCELNIISLYFVDFKKEEEKKYVSNEDKKIKCVVWDLDNTIWNGIIGDDGIDNISINKDVCSIIKELDSKGILNSVSSKNEESIAVDALKRNGLYDYFVCPHINWEPKSENIKHIAKLLDIDLNTFAFIDDSTFELKEVEKNCPSVRTCDIKNINYFLQKPCFDVPVSSESKNRRQSYKEISIRNKDQEKYHDNFDQFLKECNINIHIAKPDLSELDRCYELMQRSNQLNISLERLTQEQIINKYNDNNYDLFRIRVDDKYGDYGLVGFSIFEHKKDIIEMKHFVFSCRAARKKIEEQFFKTISNYYFEKGYKELHINCTKTSKNKLMLMVLKESKLFQVAFDTNSSISLFAKLDRKIEISSLFTIDSK